ncbi:hypothetical protein KP803_08360 [Vibrio sp. ZSDE26]|uniref:Uncharacterized protein n=1 Tax=Vibrio amylolyticus TaxID=2847292 RepID=A0A9X1XPT0_9VIBR|nr:hypothetical protein [Vibrio amylolyticus]MCK6263289.1 hypothetical protein [Vibrio amylolyticus]
MPEFSVSEFERHINISEYAGSNEDKFNALHYSRVQAAIDEASFSVPDEC